LRMEYHAIVDGVEDFDLGAQRAVLQRFLDLVIGAKWQAPAKSPGPA